MSASIWMPDAELDGLRWHADMVVTNEHGRRVWLRALKVNEHYEEDPRGRRIGITDCCLAVDPCPHHRAIAAGETP